MLVRSLILGCCLMLALGSLAAQTNPEASPEKESFLIEPGTLASGAKDATLRLVATTAAGFSASSAKLPQIKFGAGVALASGGLVILNPNEAECRVNVEDSAFGTVEVSVELYGVNGTSVLRTLRGTLGIGGPQAVEGSQVKVGVEDVRLVRVNVEQPQAAGSIVISGPVNGSVRITAPTGVSFNATPKISADGAAINAPRLEEANTVLMFGVANPGLGEARVRVSDILYNTALFTPSGGVLGDLACEIAGSALTNREALVVNAFTAKTTIEGSNDVPNEPDTDSQESDATNTPLGGGGLAPTAPQRREGERGERRRRQGETSQPGSTRRPAAGQAGAPGRAQGARPQPGVQQPQGVQGGQQGGQQGGGVTPAPAAGGPGPGHTAAGGMEDPDADAPRRSSSTGPAIVREARDLPVTPGLYFCNKDFEPVSAVVLDRIVAGEAGGRVWIMLRLPKTRNPEEIDTVTVTMTLAGTPRELTLTETGKDTGEFRCSREGILLIAEENPDSNEPEAAKRDPIPRFQNRQR